MTSPSDTGLQAERTGLAWSRTALGVGASAALLAVREIGHARPSLALLASALALVVAAATALHARRRTAQLRHAPLPVPLAASVAVPVLGGSVAVLAVVSAIALIV